MDVYNLNRKWGESIPGMMYPQIEGPGNPAWEARNPDKNPNKKLEDLPLPKIEKPVEEQVEKIEEESKYQEPKLKEMEVPSLMESEFIEIRPGKITSGILSQNLVMENGYIRSSDYESGVAGWTLNYDGTAEIRDLVLYGGTVKYNKDSFSDSTNEGYYIGAEGVYFGSASDATKLKFNIDTGAFDFIGTISGRETSTISSAINSDGHFIDDKLDTSAEEILGDFTFGASGAIKMITDANNGLWLSPTGILAKKAGDTTFTIGTDGDATFAGELSAVTGTFTSLSTSAEDGLEVDGGGKILLNEGGSIRLKPSSPPDSACTAALIETAGNVDAGTHKYKISYTNTGGETTLGSESNTVTTDASNEQVQLSNIPVSSSTFVTGRKIYRTKAGGTTYHYLATISNNTTTTYTDNIADADLPGVSDADNRGNTAYGGIYLYTPWDSEEERVLHLDCQNVFIGLKTGSEITTGSSNIGIGQSSLLNVTEGYRNIGLGLFSLLKTTTGLHNVSLGVYSSMENITGYNNTVVGSYAGMNCTGNANILIGYRAGYYFTNKSDTLLIDNRHRGNEANATAQALIYGIFDDDTADQKLTINGLLNQSVSKTPATAAATGTAGDICWDADYIYVCTATDTWKRVAISTW